MHQTEGDAFLQHCVNKFLPLKDYISVPLFIGEWKEFVATYLVFLGNKNLSMHKGSQKSGKYFQTMFKTHFLCEFFPI